MKVSVITVCYNAVSTIEASILSLLNQDYENLEYLVIDGGSTDGTIDVIKRYLPQIAHFVSEPDQGMYDAINKGIALAGGEVIGLLHANDCLADQHIISTVVQAFNRAKADAVYGNLNFYSETGRLVRKWKSAACNRLLLEMGWMPPHPTVYIKKNVFLKYGNFRLDFSTAADYELILRFFYRHKIKTVHVNQVFVKMLTGGISNKNIFNHVSGNVNDFKAMKLHDLHAPFIAVFLKPLQKLLQYF
ncbi:MAG: glycosyltransferase [Sphingobacteriaceae bacterium]|nr:MAG: glycosyltransferase [Sphingobacteriaceae bacterium]